MQAEDKKIKVYLFGCMGQIFLVAGLTYYLRKVGFVIDYTTTIGILCIIAGGCSSALWGSIVSVKYGKISVKKLFYDFFHVKEKLFDYLLLIGFLVFDFSFLLFDGHIVVSKWYLPVVIFFKALLFGGVEEIGWRYTLQPVLEKKLGFVKTTLVIYFTWGIWHFIYFYLDGSLKQIEMVGFYTGLFTNCFLLGMLYHKTNSLWLCVAAHALINTFSQIFTGGSEIAGYFIKFIIVIMSCVLVYRRKKDDKRTIFTGNF